MDIFIGIDFGTSGCRAVAIDADDRLLGQVALTLPPARSRQRERLQDAAHWREALWRLLREMHTRIDPRDVRAVAIDGTSATLLPLGRDGQPIGPSRLYNDSSQVEAAGIIARHAPLDSPARGPTSSLAKALGFMRHYGNDLARVAHQADWLAACLHGKQPASDLNNALKLGYDPAAQRWPDWLAATGLPMEILPDVREPGSVIGRVSAQAAHATGLPRDCAVVAGTTDSMAAFIATGAKESGEAVTSLGTTMVLKIVSPRPVANARYGIYSHRLGNLWVAGGASNAGAGVLRRYFSDSRLRQLSAGIDPAQSSGLDYYPLTAPGERFPVCDPDYPPRLTPRPDDDRRFLHGLLEGLAAIERLGYQRLAEAGAPSPSAVHTTGGGSVNETWRQIRQRFLGLPVDTAAHSDAAWGAAMLARQGVSPTTARPCA